MNTGADQVPGRLDELRRAFDRAFAAVPAVRNEEVEDLLAVRVAGEAYWVAVAELAGIVPAGRIVPLPGPAPALLGLAGIRGGLVPVYGLAALLGHAAGGPPPRWLALAAGPEAIAFALDALEEYRRVPRALVRASAATAPDRRHVTGVVQCGAETRPLVSLASAAAAVRGRTANEEGR